MPRNCKSPNLERQKHAASTEGQGQVLPGGYVLQQQLARTHFSSVWLASAPLAPSPQPPPPEAPIAVSKLCKQTHWSGYPFGSADLVVVKAVEASRPTHAAVAANEAAALRHLKVASTATATAAPSLLDGLSSIKDAMGTSKNAVAMEIPHPAAATANNFPFVRLLDTFTTDLLPMSAAALGADVEGNSEGSVKAANQLAPGQRGRGRWRCLVLERLGPTAADLLGNGQRHQQHQRPHFEGQAQQRVELRWSGVRDPHTPQVEAPRRGGWGPREVKRFAAHALAALEQVHRSARLVHCDIKPENFALRLHPSTLVMETQHSRALQPPAGHVTSGQDVIHSGESPGELCLNHQGHGQWDGGGSSGRSPGGAGEQRGKQPQHGDDGRQRSPAQGKQWTLLDFGSACSLEPGGQRVARGPVGHETQCIVRPCAVLHGSEDSSPAHVWYDTPSYAAPELTMGLPPSPASDMWSLGCTVFELATGKKLLPLPPQLLGMAVAAGGGSGESSSSCSSRSNAAEFHLALVAGLLGPPPRSLLQRGPRAGWFFDVPRRTLLLEEEYELPPACSLSQRLGVEASSRQLTALPGRGGFVDVTVAALSKGGWRLALPAGKCDSTVACMELDPRGLKTKPAEATGRWAKLAPWRCQGAPGGGRVERWLPVHTSGCWGAEVGAEDGGGARSEDSVWSEVEWSGLQSFLTPLLQWEPWNRPPAHEAALHGWLATV